MIVDAIRAAAHDKLTVFMAGMGLATWATLELWVKYAGTFAGNLVPIASLVMIAVTIYVRLYPRQPTPALEKKEAAKAGWSAGKKFGVFVGAFMAVAAVLMFWKSDAKAATPQALVSAPAGKKRKASDDDGSEGDGDVQDPDDVHLAPWFLKAKAVIGTAEALDNGRPNPEVQKMFLAVDGWPADKNGIPRVDCRNVPWCAVFVNWALAQAGIAGTRNAMARSFAHSRAFKQLPEPRIGCIVVMWRGQQDDGESGHVGFYAGAGQGRYFNMLGGNQSDMVKVAKFHDSRVIGYFWPRSKLESRTGRGAVAATVATSTGAGAVAYDALAPDDSKIPGIPDGVSVDAARETLEPIREALEASGHPRAMRIAELIGLGLVLLGVGAAIYTWWRHSKDHDAGRL